MFLQSVTPRGGGERLQADSLEQLTNSWSVSGVIVSGIVKVWLPFCLLYLFFLGGGRPFGKKVVFFLPLLANGICHYLEMCLIVHRDFSKRVSLGTIGEQPKVSTGRNFPQTCGAQREAS